MSPVLEHGQLYDQLRGIVAEVGQIPRDFNPAAHFYNDLGMASVKALHLLLALEDRYGVSIQDDEFVDATSLDALHRLMTRLLGQT
jgi:acyl carrier protein